MCGLSIWKRAWARVERVGGEVIVLDEETRSKTFSKSVRRSAPFQGWGDVNVVPCTVEEFRMDMEKLLKE